MGTGKAPEQHQGQKIDQVSSVPRRWHGHSTEYYFGTEVLWNPEKLHGFVKIRCLASLLMSKFCIWKKQKSNTLKDCVPTSLIPRKSISGAKASKLLLHPRDYSAPLHSKENKSYWSLSSVHMCGAHTHIHIYTSHPL